MRSSGQRFSAVSAGQDEVLLDVQAAEDAPILVHQLHAGARDGVALLACDLGTVEHDRAVARRDDAHQALQGRALARAVAAEQRHHLVALDAQRDVEQDVTVPVVGVEPVDLEQAHSAANTPCTPPR